MRKFFFITTTIVLTIILTLSVFAYYEYEEQTETLEKGIWYTTYHYHGYKEFGEHHVDHVYYIPGVHSSQVSESDLENFVIPEKLRCFDCHSSHPVTAVSPQAFKECTYFEKISLPKSVEVIGQEAFMSSTISAVTISNGTQTIMDSAFFGCGNLKKVKIPASVQRIDSCSFSGCYQLSEFTVDENNNSFYVKDGILFGYDNSIVQYPITRTETEYTIPDGIETIRGGSFSCSSLERIIIPDSVTTIEEYAFAKCENLKEIVIGKKVWSIGQGAFYLCDNIETVLYTGNEKKWDYIEFSENNEPILFADITYNYDIDEETKNNQINETKITNFPAILVIVLLVIVAIIALVIIITIVIISLTKKKKTKSNSGQSSDTYTDNKNSTDINPANSENNK